MYNNVNILFSQTYHKALQDLKSGCHVVNNTIIVTILFGFIFISTFNLIQRDNKHLPRQLHIYCGRWRD